LSYDIPNPLVNLIDLEGRENEKHGDHSSDYYYSLLEYGTTSDSPSH
jgi:hypothetical protein